MSNHKLTRYFYEDQNVIFSRSWNSWFKINLTKLSNAAMQETLLSNCLPRVFEHFFDTALVPGDTLKWLGQGLGIGEEIKRGYSALFGRFFARDFLNSEIKPQCLLPIDRYHLKILEDFSISLSTKLKKKGKRSPSLPDWIGYSNDEIIVAEAKGSHDKSCWERKFVNGEYPKCLNNAIKQVKSVDLKISNKVRLPFTGWSIASRWSTQENMRDPWLAAIKIKHSYDKRIGMKVGPEIEYLKRVIHIVNLERILSGMGHFWWSRDRSWSHQQEVMGFIRNNLLEFVPNYLSITIENETYTGIFSAISVGGIEPIANTNDLKRYNQLNRKFGNVYLVMVSKFYFKMMKSVLVNLFDRIRLENTPIDEYSFEDDFFDEFKFVISDQIVMINEIAVIKLNSIDF